MPNRFPIIGGRKLNFGSGFDIRPTADGWVNLDGFVEHPDIVKHDLAKFPYPFPDNSFDCVFAHHVFEHIPLLYLDYRGVDRDVLYFLMEELHRILKPGGRLHVVSPLGSSPEAMSHVQHYRRWYPKSFTYFEATPHGTEVSKYHRADFVVERIGLNRNGTRWPFFLPMGRHKLGVFEHLRIRAPWLFGRLLAARDEIEALLIARKK